MAPTIQVNRVTRRSRIRKPRKLMDSADHFSENDHTGRAKHRKTDDLETFANRLGVGDRDWRRLGCGGLATRSAGKDQGDPGEWNQKPFPILETTAGSASRLARVGEVFE
jgi:hypothetical protein